MGSRKQNEKIPTIYECDSNGRENQTVVADLDGTLLVGPNSFAYFALIAFDVGGLPRLLLLLLAAPIAAILYYFVSEAAGIKVMIFATFAGVKLSSINSAANVVLPKHYSEDLHPETWRVFASCGTKCVLTANPRIMVEPFLKNYLDVDIVLGTEISSFKGMATGLVAGGNLLVGENKAIALKKAFGNQERPHIGIGDRHTDFPFMKLCKERYIVPRRPEVRPLPKESLPKPVIFHDGRLVQKPTPLIALAIILWLPIGVPLSILRVLVALLVPLSSMYYVIHLLGCPVTVKGTPPPNPKHSSDARGMLYVCSHRTLADPVIVSACLHRAISTISYSVPGLCELFSPIKSFRLTRERAKDAQLMDEMLNEGKEAVMFPEGTTCREPYLLRFSSLFAELTHQIVPVAVAVKTTMFYGNTARGYKGFDHFIMYMNPMPVYEITFLKKLPENEICKGGKSNHEVANHIQEMIGKTFGYKCTHLRRKDKYRALAGTDGIVGQKPAGAGLVSCRLIT